MSRLKWIIFAVVVLGMLGGIIWLNKSEDTTFSGDASKIITEGPIADRVFGSTGAKVVLIEYGDFQCPGCAAMFEPVKQLTEKYQDKLAFIFRNLPLTNIHPNALAASTAAEAAGQQGKFWEMFGLLYQDQTTWSGIDPSQRTAIFEGYASQLGLDTNRFRQDLQSTDISAKISRDRATAKGFNADSTPTFIIDGDKFDPTKSTDQQALTDAVETALKSAYGEPL